MTFTAIFPRSMRCSPHRPRSPRRRVRSGDLVGYGASPNEVTERIRASGIPTIMGNYDDGVGFDRDECGCAYRDPIDRQLGDRSFAWTKAHVTHDNRAFLRTLHKETHPTRISAPPPQFPVILNRAPPDGRLRRVFRPISRVDLTKSN